MLPLSVKKLLHQHLIDLLHSRKAITATLLGIILLLISVVQFGDTLLEWSVEKCGMIGQIKQSTGDNIAGLSFERKLCYHFPIDVVYTWVNGSDPWHQDQLELYRKVAEHVSEVTENYENLTTANKNSATGLDHVDGLAAAASKSREARCGSSYCVQAKAVLVTPAISRPDLSEVLDNVSLDRIMAYTLPNHTLALTKESFNLDKLLEERTLQVNDGKFTFHSVHLTVLSKDISFSDCKPLEFARMVVNVKANVNEETIKAALPASLRTQVLRIDIYRSSQLAVIYFRPENNAEYELKSTAKIMLDGGKELALVEVCFLADIRPNAMDNEMRLSRFKDNEELRFSIRSLEKHAGWVRRIYIVTNGQVPHWLNLDNPKVQIVTHEEIFVNKSHLPTFSSSAIESHLHRIPGLSDKFLYFNDDVLLTQDVLPEDFFSHSEGYKIHLSWHVPSCADGCPSGWIRDGFCDATCNNIMCNFDGGDCTNKTSVLSIDDDDDFGMGDFQFAGTCHPGCLNAWLADRYCDAVCNHRECGFDVGDCGLDKLASFPHISLSESDHFYAIPSGELTTILNTADVFSGKNWTLKEGTYRQAKGIRTISVYPQRHTIVVLLYFNATGSTTLTLTYTKEDDSTTDFEMALEFDSSPQLNSEEPSEVSARNVIEIDAPMTFPTVPAELRGPKPISDEAIDFAWMLDANLTVDHLREMLFAGDLTEYGFERRKAALLGIPMNASYTRPSTLSTVIESKSDHSASPSTTVKSSAPNEEEEEPPTPSRGRRTTRHHRPGGLAKHKSKQAVQYKDAYADSLRHVNRLYNDAFGIEARKVPAHIPHFVDRTVMAELQAKFAAEFDATSGTRVRSGRDMQFAFSYFHYIMNIQKEIGFREIFDEIDTDHSGSWNEREIYLAAVRSTDEEMSDVKFAEFRAVIQACSDNGTGLDAGSGSTYNVVQKEASAIPREMILNCGPVKETLLAQHGKRKRFKFRTTADMEAFTFVRVGNNASIINKQLQEILRHPKKFICVNDEVDYTREDSATVQTIVRNFFQTLYPLPSAFELPLGERNNFSQIKEYQLWKTKSIWLKNGLIATAVVLLLLFSCLLFPRRRRLIFRRVRLWMRNRDIDRAMILHT